MRIEDQPELELRRLAEKGRRAQAIFDDEIMVEAVENARATAFEAFLSLPLSDEGDKMARTIKMRVNALESVLTELKEMANNGLIAQAELDARSKAVHGPSAA